MITRSNTAALIPCYFEEKHIQDIARRTLAQLDQVLVVDDGSTDDTEFEARESGAEVIKHFVNQGKGAAIKTGLHVLSMRKSVECVLILDGDGQHLPEEIPAFIEAAISEDDFFFTLRNTTNGITRIKKMVINRKVSR